jgi:hypothetical protein
MATQQNGLTMLGEAISGASRDYLGRTRQLQDETRQRGNQLADEQRRRGQQLEDVDSARAYERSTYNRRRADALTDVAGTRTYEDERFRKQLDLQTQQGIALGLVHEGILAPGDINNPEAVARAFEVARTRGLDKLYGDLLTTPDASGKPLLDRSQMNDPAAIEAAKSALSKVRAETNRLAMDQPGNAATAVGDLAREAAQVRQQLAQVEQRLSAEAPKLDPVVVNNRALQLAKDANGGKTPSQQQIQAMVPQAQQEASQMALQQWYQDKEDAKIQYQILNARLNNLRSTQSDLTRTFQVAPKPSALQEPAPAAAPARGAQLASPEQMSAALAAAVRGAPGAKPPAGAGAPPVAQAAAILANPIDDPIIAQENQRRTQSNLSAQNKMLADPYNAALDELASIGKQIESVRAGAPLLRQGPDEFGVGLTVPRDPSMQASALSDLLIKQQAVQRAVEEKRRAMLGLPAGVTAPTVSDSQSSAPAAYAKPDDWWRGQ